MNLSQNHKQRLVKRLLDCPCIQADRDTVVAQLPPVIRNSIEQSEHPKVHVLHILETCIRYPWGLEYLIQVIHFLGEETSQLALFYDELQIIQRTYQCISSNRMAELWQLLQRTNVCDRELKALYNSVSPITELVKTYEGMDILACMLDTLAKMSVEPGRIHPLLKFTVHFIHQTNNTDIQHSITAWIEGTAAYLSISQEDINHLVATSNPVSPASFPLYLLIELEPKAEASNSYIVQAWAWSEYRKQRIYAEDTPRSLDSIPSIIKNLIEIIVDDCLITNNLPTIEFFLPRSLINQDIDQWVLEEEETLGFCYSMSVRFRERATDRKYWPAWFRRWNGFDQGEQDERKRIEKVCCIEECSSRTLRRRLEEVVCLVLTCTLPSGSETQNTLHSMMLRSGTPIALYPRQCKGTPAEIQQEIEAMIECDGLERLPDTVWKRRRDAWEGSNLMTGKHLTLLWDDPNRLPHKQMYLEAPEMSC